MRKKRFFYVVYLKFNSSFSYAYCLVTSENVSLFTAERLVVDRVAECTGVTLEVDTSRVSTSKSLKECVNIIDMSHYE